jgi:Tol biopolymer transport system component
MTLRTASLAALLLAAVAAPGASASFPGSNGKFAVVVEACPPGEDDDGDRRRLRAYSANGKNVGELTDCTADRFGPNWSADGTRVAFVQGGGDDPFGSVAADGSDLRPIPVDSKGGSSGFYGPSFAPDGEQVVFTFAQSIFRSRLDGSALEELRPQASCNGNSDNCTDLDGPVWSPDGKTIAFESQQFAFGPGKKPKLKPGIWLMRASDGKLIRRVAKGGGQVDWSPDSKRLVFASAYERDENGKVDGGNLYVVRANGKGKPRRVARTGTTALAVPTWAPDGNSIAYIDVRFTAGDVGFDVKPTLRRLPARGGESTKLAKLPEPYQEEGFYNLPDLSWQPLPLP